MEPGFIYRFDRFVLDTSKHVLLSNDEPVHLTPKAFDVLVLLLSSGGSVVSRAELMERVWPGVCVEDSNVSQTILMLRRALGDGNGNGAARFIETIWGLGYKMAASVRCVSTLRVGTSAH